MGAAACAAPLAPLRTMPTRRSNTRRALWAGGLLVLQLAPLVVAALYLGQSNITPRRLAPYLE